MTNTWHVRHYVVLMVLLLKQTFHLPTTTHSMCHAAIWPLLEFIKESSTNRRTLLFLMG